MGQQQKHQNTSRGPGSSCS